MSATPTAVIAPKTYEFDPRDPSQTLHRRLGVWDVYEKRVPQSLGVSWLWTRWSEWPITSPFVAIRKDSQTVVRMLKDVASLKSCRYLSLVYIALELVTTLLPALELSCEGRLLEIVRIATEERRVDRNMLLLVSLGAFGISNLTSWLVKVQTEVSEKIRRRIRTYYAEHTFKAVARLDLPTFDDPIVQAEIEDCERESLYTPVAHTAIFTFVRTSSSFIGLATQVSVLYSILKNHPNGLLMATLCGSYITLHNSNLWSVYTNSWAATVRDEDYIRLQGLKVSITKPEHRKEIVAGGLYPFFLSLYRSILSKMGGQEMEKPELAIDRELDAKLNTGPYAMFLQVLKILPEVAFTYYAIRRPQDIPLSATGLQLIRRTVKNLSFSALSLNEDFRVSAKTLGSVKRLYALLNIPNRVKVELPRDIAESDTAMVANVDLEQDEQLVGVPFPEGSQTLSSGISLEFCDVSFKYPETETYVLRNISFSIQQGGLCVIVGNNGSGKSTILKLIARLYDPTEGKILIDGQDIRTLRLQDLRSAISVLFQDYTIFPLSLRDNIGLGDVSHFSSFDVIQQAAELGGAAGFIEKLPEGYDTYLERPVRDEFSYDYADQGPPNPFKTAGEGGHYDNSKRDLSGGQKQRIALSRVFMRTIGDDESVGMLVFDEPSASLDPTAEHDLFERLRKLRGNKTMIFSSHRFGNLTKHADLILYIHESQVIEAGTHQQLLEAEGEYKRIWTLQAKAFL